MIVGMSAMVGVLASSSKNVHPFFWGKSRSTVITLGFSSAASFSA